MVDRQLHRTYATRFVRAEQLLIDTTGTSPSPSGLDTRALNATSPTLPKKNLTNDKNEDKPYKPILQVSAASLYDKVPAAINRVAAVPAEVLSRNSQRRKTTTRSVQEQFTLAISAAEENDVDKLKKVGHAALVACDDYAWTPLHIAAANGANRAVEYLVNVLSVDELKQTDMRGLTAMEIAALSGHGNLAALMHNKLSVRKESAAGSDINTSRASSLSDVSTIYGDNSHSDNSETNVSHVEGSEYEDCRHPMVEDRLKVPKRETIYVSDSDDGSTDEGLVFVGRTEHLPKPCSDDDSKTQAVVWDDQYIGDHPMMEAEFEIPMTLPHETKHDESMDLFCEACQVTYAAGSNHLNSIAHQVASKQAPKHFVLKRGNIGYQLMLKSGWNEEQGLGPNGEGRLEPIKTVLKPNRAGIGTKGTGKNLAKVTHFEAFDKASVTNQNKKSHNDSNEEEEKPTSGAIFMEKEKQREKRLRLQLDGPTYPALGT